MLKAILSLISSVMVLYLISCSSTVNGCIDDDDVLPRHQLNKDNDKIESLPGQPLHVNFTQYGGYITIDESVGRAMYYYFVEVEESKESKPLLLWLNGGPGCSSLTGAFEELGPFKVGSDGKTLYQNIYAWNKVANVLFLESPAGVGFSYSNQTSDYNLNGDTRTAEDNYVFLVNWLERFPEHKDRDLYLSGESYAGHYVPQLVHTILKHNKMENKSSFMINLKGVIIGNAVINNKTDQIGTYDYLWTHGIISDETIDAIHKHCNFSGVSISDVCSELLMAASLSIYPHQYNIYAPRVSLIISRMYPRHLRYALVADPCQHIYTDAYLNTAEVQKALHANVTKLNYTWDSCSGVVHDDWTDKALTTIPLLHELMASGLRVWVYSGDMDSVVPITSTKYSLNQLHLPTKFSYRPWSADQELAGYTMVYKGDLTFATVRGAGHMVPSDQPSRALTLIKHFLDGELLPRYF